MGSTAIQLAVASGLDVITTASARSAPSVKALGAKVVVDYNSPSMTDALVSAVKSFGGQSTFVGIYDAIGQGGWQEVLQKLGGGRVAIVLPFSEEVPPDVTLSQGEQSMSQFLLFLLFLPPSSIPIGKNT